MSRFKNHHLFSYDKHFFCRKQNVNDNISNIIHYNDDPFVQSFLCVQLRNCLDLDIFSFDDDPYILRQTKYNIIIIIHYLLICMSIMIFFVFQFHFWLVIIFMMKMMMMIIILMVHTSAIIIFVTNFRLCHLFFLVQNEKNPNDDCGV